MFTLAPLTPFVASKKFVPYSCNLFEVSCALHLEKPFLSSTSSNWHLFALKLPA
jgi:hypothetical protein